MTVVDVTKEMPPPRPPSPTPTEQTTCIDTNNQIKSIQTIQYTSNEPMSRLWVPHTMHTVASRAVRLEARKAIEICICSRARESNRGRVITPLCATMKFCSLVLVAMLVITATYVEAWFGGDGACGKQYTLFI